MTPSRSPTAPGTAWPLRSGPPIRTGPRRWAAGCAPGRSRSTAARSIRWPRSAGSASPDTDASSACTGWRSSSRSSPCSSERVAAVRVYLGSDHAGFELKAALIEWLTSAGHEPVDSGPPAYHHDDDYPPYVMHAADGVITDPGSLGIVIGGSG